VRNCERITQQQSQTFCCSDNAHSPASAVAAVAGAQVAEVTIESFPHRAVYLEKLLLVISVAREWKCKDFTEIHDVQNVRFMKLLR
jgi:hypothetical protein